MRPTLYLAAALALFLGLCYLMVRLYAAPMVDDAYISLIYARNLAHGKGLTYTNGVRVEGYTDFLWVLILAGSMKVNVDPALTARVLGVSSGAFLLLVVWLWSKRFSAVEPRLQLGALGLACMTPLAFWAIAGLEEVPFACLLLSATVLVGASRSLLVAGLLYFLAALLHPDAVIWIAIAVLYVAARPGEGRWRRSAVLALSALLPFALYWLGRSFYFGDLMPNTFYAKSSPSPRQLLNGLQYVLSFAPVLAWAAFGVLVARTGSLWRRFDLGLLLVQSVTWLGYLVWIGGDGLLMHRMLLPVLAPMAILIQESLPIRVPLPRALMVAVTTPMLLLLALSPLKAIRYDGRLDQSRVELGRWLRQNSEPNAVIAVNAAGALPYFAERSAIDMLGLNDEHIAHKGHADPRAPAGHQRFDAEYVLAQRPDFIVLSPLREEGQGLQPGEGILPSIEALLAAGEFWGNYDRLEIPGLAFHEMIFKRITKREAPTEIRASLGVNRG